MTPELIKIRLEQICQNTRDPELAHAMEEGLMREFILHVASIESNKELSEMAKAVLSSEEINFPRWTA